MSENVPPGETVRSERHDSTHVVTIDRPAIRNAVFGGYNRRWGIPLVDGGHSPVPSDRS